MEPMNQRAEETMEDGDFTKQDASMEVGDLKQDASMEDGDFTKQDASMEVGDLKQDASMEDGDLMKQDASMEDDESKEDQSRSKTWIRDEGSIESEGGMELAEVQVAAAEVQVAAEEVQVAAAEIQAEVQLQHQGEVQAVVAIPEVQAVAANPEVQAVAAAAIQAPPRVHCNNTSNLLLKRFARSLQNLEDGRNAGLGRHSLWELERQVQKAAEKCREKRFVKVADAPDVVTACRLAEYRGFSTFTVQVHQGEQNPQLRLMEMEANALGLPLIVGEAAAAAAEEEEIVEEED